MVDRVSEFAGVYVEELSIKTVDPVGRQRGGSKSMQFLPSEMVGREKIMETVDGLKELFNFTVDEYELQYDLLVRGRTKSSAIIKARGYALVTNPFSSSLVDDVSATTANDKDWLTDIGPISEFYNIRVTVIK